MKPRILIADDHAIVRKGLIQLLLENYPHAGFGEVNNAEELLAEVLKREWDIVICDINMPGRSGIDALQQIKKSIPDMPVLIMSMYPEDQYALRAFKAGASGYLGKETIHSNLITAVEKVLAGKKFITPGVAEEMANILNEERKKLPHESLSNREFEVLVLLATGKPSSEIAKKLSISITTVSTYRTRVLEKLKMKSNADLVKYALEANLI